jgi:hypothetical protein
MRKPDAIEILRRHGVKIEIDEPEVLPVAAPILAAELLVMVAILLVTAITINGHSIFRALAEMLP